MKPGPFVTRDGFSYGGTDAWNREHAKWLKRRKRNDRILGVLLALVYIVVFLALWQVSLWVWHTFAGIFWEAYRNVGA